MEWKHLFDSKTLKAGYNYYLKENVQEIEEVDGGYFARVEDSKEYFVRIKLRKGNVTGAGCSCSKAMEGKKCKHMAAVLYLLDEINEAETAKKREDFDLAYFVGEDDEENYFNIRRILDVFSIDNKMLLEAKEFLDKGMMKLMSISSVYLRTGKQCLKIEGEFTDSRGRSEDVEIFISNDKIMDAYCRECYRSLGNYYYGYGDRLPCTHMLALMFLADKTIRELNVGDYTDYNGDSIIRAFRRKNAGENVKANDELSKIVKIEPRLERPYIDSIELSFKIGHSKMYILKDMKKLVESYDRNEIFTLGKNNEINFAVDKFDEKSKEYFDFIYRQVKIEEKRVKMLRYSYAETGTTINKSMNLFGNRIDEFFELANGKKIEFKDSSRGAASNSTLLCEEGRVDIKFDISAKKSEKGKFLGLNICGDIPEFFDGISGQYCIDGNKFKKIEEEQKKTLLPIGNIAENNMDESVFSFTVGKKNISEFYYYILPLLEEIAEINIEDEDAIEALIPPKGEFVFYLDAEDGDITCRACCKYGELEFDIEASKVAHDNLRDMHREGEVFESVSEIFAEYIESEKLFTCNGDEDFVYDVLEHGVDMLLEYGIVNSTSAFNRLKIKKKPAIKVGVSIESNLLDINVTSSDYTEEELVDIFNSYKKKKKYHRLKNGDFISLTDNALEEISEMFDAMNVSLKDFVNGKMQLPAYRALYLDKMLEENEEIYTERDKHFKQMIKEFKTVKESDSEVSKSLEEIMRKYQVYGFKWLKTLENYGFGGILADEMGLGKTLQVISVMLSDKEAGEEGTSLVVCPASLVYNWVEEFEKFAPQLKVEACAGVPSERKKIIEEYADTDVIVTSYDLLKRDITHYEEKRFKYEIIDEAQFIKNHKTAASKAVKIIKAETKFALTGTPIENRLSELWSIFDYLMPGYLYSYEDFRSSMENNIVKYKDENSMNQLKKMVSPFILRRLKKDVLKDIPEKIEEVHYARFEDEQANVYNGQVVKMKKMLQAQDPSEFNKNKIKILAELMKIRQICCDPSLILENYKGESAKKQAAMELIESAIEGDHKVLLFSQFTTMLEILEESLKKEKIEYYKITGETPKQKRLEMVKEFNEGDVRVFLISLRAGGTGLNLTGADIVIHYDPWWNVAVQNQATDRAHRIGQKNVVTVYKLIAKNTIEEKILKLQEDKKELADEILSGETGGIMNMTRDDLLELL